MATFSTTTGRTVTAATREDAAALAAQYGMGELVASVSRPRRQAAGVFVLMDDLAQSEVARGSLEQVAQAWYQDEAQCPVLLAVTSRGTRPANTSELRRLAQMMEDAG